MTTQPSWRVQTPRSKYGLDDTAVTPIETPLHSIAGPGVADQREAKPWDPQSPFFWFAAIAAATFGLMAVSVSGRAGPVKASVAVGKT